MAADLDDLIEWLLSKVRSRGTDGVSLSQLLILIDTFYVDPEKHSNESPGTRTTSRDDGNPKIDHDFRSKVWRLFATHEFVSVGEDGRGNDLTLSEIEALQPAVANGSGHPQNSSPGTIDAKLPQEDGPEILGSYVEDASSPSAQLLEQFHSQSLMVRPRIYVLQKHMGDPKTPAISNNIGMTIANDSLVISHRDDGSPLKLKTNDPPRRRGRPPKAKPSIPASGSSPSLTIPEQPSSTGKRTLRVRPPRNMTLFTSHEESSQRASGKPGVYFDVMDIGKPGVGRPRKKKLALFKSEKLKNFPWMKGISGNHSNTVTSNQSIGSGERAAVGDTTENSTQEQRTSAQKRARDNETSSDEPKSKRPLLDIVRGFGSSHPALYKSPYVSSPAAPYMSHHAADDSTMTPYTTREGSLPLAAIDASRGSSTTLLVETTGISGLMSSYRSPYAPVQAEKFNLMYKSSTSNPGAEQSQINETFQPVDDSNIEAAIKAVEKLAIPDITARLPSVRNGVAGNLYLSMKEKLLTFIPGEQVEMAPIVIKISDIVGSPETSTFGSDVMVLRITASGTNGTEEIHQFRFLPTEEAFDSANIMRAKIVTAMVLFDLKSNAEIDAIEKPFTCSGCDRTWKNFEGLKYHQTKSKTSCNPQYRLRKASASFADQDSSNRVHTALDVSNEDKVLLFQNTSLPGGSCEGAVTKKQHAKRSDIAATRDKSKDARSNPDLQGGKDIIIGLLNANEHVFPGETSLWFAFVAASLRKSPDTGLPSYNSCSMALDLLADTGKIRKVQFSFKDKTGLMKTRTLITRCDVDPTSDVVVTMKEKIKAAFPSYYVPQGFAPPNVVQSMLEERKNRLGVEDIAQKANRVAPTSQAHNPAKEQSLDALTPPVNDASTSKTTRSGRISRRPLRLEQEISRFYAQNLEDDANEEEEDSYSESFSNLTSTSRAAKISADGQLKRRWSKASKKNLQGSDPTLGAESLVRDNHITSSQSIENESQQDTELDRPERKRNKNGLRLPGASLDCKPTWQPASTYLQRKNGTWSIPTPPRLIRKYAPRTNLPEPITYMQSLHDSSWSSRPYGHGVRPIHARPAKRAEGQTAYLTRIQHGFRPVIMPNGDLFIPSAPSFKATDQALGAAIEGVSRKARPTGQKRKLKECASNIAETDDSVVEVFSEPAVPTSRTDRYEWHSSKGSKNGVGTVLISQAQRDAEFSNASLNSTNQSLPLEDEKSINLSSFPLLSNHFLEDFDQRVSHTPGELWDEVGGSNGSFRGDKSQEPDQSIPLAQNKMTSRRLTALPADIEGVEEFLVDHPDLKVEVAVDHQHNVRRRTREGAISPDTEYRLMVAIVVIRTLTGGLDKQIDWVLVSRLFPDLPMNAVSKRWPTIVTKFKQIVERLGADFQEFFLEAYERGDVKPIDYDHLVDYDWNSLIDLVLEQVEINPGKTVVHRLPASRATLDQMFTMNNAENTKAWRDDYFGLLPAAYKRLEFAGSEQYTTAGFQHPSPSLEIDPLTVAKSWARANTLTPSESYNKDFAARKLASIGKGVISAATSALFDAKVLMQRNKGRPTPNRGVEITDTFASALRKHLDETHLSQAAAFKASLDASFHAHEIVMVDWAAKDGDVLAITNLQAHGRIMLEPHAVPMNRFGLTGGGYQTKRMDKAKLRFDMRIRPTPSYIYDPDLPILSALTPYAAPPAPGRDGAIPVWCDIADNLLPAMWKKVLCVVLATIAMRPGVVIAELVRIFTPVLEEWEMRVLVDWAVRVGALTPLSPECEGWNVAEWWWVVGGRA